MQVKTVSITYGRKLNLQDFNSATIEVSTWAELEEGEDSREAIDALFAQAKEIVREQAQGVAHKLSAQVREVMYGLPRELQQEAN
jgi:hypothetical protein